VKDENWHFIRGAERGYNFPGEGPAGRGGDLESPEGPRRPQPGHDFQVSFEKSRWCVKKTITQGAGDPQRDYEGGGPVKVTDSRGRRVAASKRARLTGTFGGTTRENEQTG